MSKIPSMHRGEPGARRGAGRWGWRVRGQGMGRRNEEGDQEVGGGEGEGAESGGVITGYWGEMESG